jgi:hypothetical protein
LVVSHFDCGDASAAVRLLMTARISASSIKVTTACIGIVHGWSFCEGKMGVRNWAAILACVCLLGCAGRTLSERLPGYIGQPASALISRLGHPTAEQNIAGKKVYVWSTNQFIEGTSYGCKIRVIVDAKDIVTTWDLDGNEGGCDHYASRLR